MDRSRPGARAALALAAYLTAAPAMALGPGWAYVDLARSWGTPQDNESGKGEVAHLRVPVSEQFFVLANAARLDAHYVDRNAQERFQLASTGIGMHTVERSVHLFAEAYYAYKWRALHAPGDESRSTEGGVGIAAGAHWMATPWLSVEGQYGIKGYVIDGFTKLDVGLRLLPHVWLLGTFHHGQFSGNEYCAGLRWAWQEYSYSQLPAARLDGTVADGRLAIGDTLIALRPLVPQAKPLQGATELPAIPEGAQLVLQESADNRFGTWWRVGSGLQSGWVREAELLGVP